MPQIMRFSIEDKADYVYYKSKMNKKLMNSIENSANEAARRINSNADLNTAKELIGIENAAREIAESQIQAAYIIDASIQASTDRIIEGQRKNTDKIVDSIEDLKALFDTRSAQMIWLLEQNHKELMSLLEKMYGAMITPTETDAKEKTKWAINAYNKGWFDQAIEYFNISKQLYPFDFIVYQFLGNIYLFERKEPEKALENYKLALKYLADSSPYYTSLAFLHIGLSHYLMREYQDAYNASYSAIQINPELSEANYRCAQNCSKLGRYDEAIEYLRKAIDADRGYSLKALADEDFVSMSGRFKDLMEELTRSERMNANEEIKKTNQLINTFNDVGVPNEVRYKLEEGINILNVGTYPNFRDAKYKAKASQKGLIDSLTTKLSENVSELESSIKNTKNKLEQTTIPFDIRKDLLASGIITIFGGMMILIYGHTPVYQLGDFTEKILYLSLIGLIFSIPATLYFSIKAAPFWYKSKSYANELRTLEQTISRKRDIMTNVKSNKDKLNIDKLAESLNYIDYEKYLRKTYG
jgi:tetratricopeptide (TPR) repeat protein